MPEFNRKHRRSLMVAHRDGRLNPKDAELMGLEPPTFRCSTCGMMARSAAAAIDCCTKPEIPTNSFTGWKNVVCITKDGGELKEALMALARESGACNSKAAGRLFGLYNGYMDKIRFGGFRITDRPYAKISALFPDGIPGVIMQEEKNRGSAGKRDRSRDQVHVQSEDRGEVVQEVLVGIEGEEVRGNPWGDPGPF